MSDVKMFTDKQLQLKLDTTSTQLHLLAEILLVDPSIEVWSQRYTICGHQPIICQSFFSESWSLSQWQISPPPLHHWPETPLPSVSNFFHFHSSIRLVPPLWGMVPNPHPLPSGSATAHVPPHPTHEISKMRIVFLKYYKGSRPSLGIGASPITRSGSAILPS